jgi:hypothetical protein
MGEEHQLTLGIMSYLSWAYHSQRRLSEAVNMQDDVVGIRRRISGEEDPRTIIDVRNLGMMRDDLDKMTKMVTTDDCLDT